MIKKESRSASMVSCVSTLLLFLSLLENVWSFYILVLLYVDGHWLGMRSPWRVMKMFWNQKKVQLSNFVSVLIHLKMGNFMLYEFYLKTIEDIRSVLWWSKATDKQNACQNPNTKITKVQDKLSTENYSPGTTPWGKKSGNIFCHEFKDFN